LFSKWPLPSGFSNQSMHAFLIFPMRVTYPTYLILLDLITLTTLGEAYNLWSSSLCSLVQPPATPSLLGPNILWEGQKIHLVNVYLIRFPIFGKYFIYIYILIANPVLQLHDILSKFNEDWYIWFLSSDAPVWVTEWTYRQTYGPVDACIFVTGFRFPSEW
jgi:hypothetical protein